MHRTGSLLVALIFLAGCGQAGVASPSTEAAPEPTAAVGVAGSPTMYRGGPERTGVFPGPAPDGDVGEAWRANLGAAIRSQPAVFDGLAYVTVDDGALVAVELSSGAETWRYAAGDGMSSSPAVADGVVVAVTNGGQVFAVDAANGGERWTREADAAPQSMPAVVGDVLYVGTDAGGVIALDLATGDERWSYDAGAAVTRSVAVGGGSVYFGAEDATFHAVDAETGDARWTRRVVGGRIGTPAVGGDLVYVVTLDAPHSGVIALAVGDGEERWRFEPDQARGIRPVVLADGTLYVADYGGTIYLLDPNSGTVRSSFTQPSEIRAAPAFVDGKLYVAAFDRIFALDVADGTESWSVAIDANVEYGPVVADGLAIAGTYAGTLYAIGAGEAVARASAPPSLTPTPEPNDIAELVVEIPAEPGMLYTQGPAVAEDGTIYVLDMSGRVLVYDADARLIDEWGEPGSGPGQLDFIRDDNEPENSIGDVALAPDGTLWIANPDNFRVDHFTVDGDHLGSIGSFGGSDGQFVDPFGVTVSADGKIYVVDDQRDIIQRFAPDGTFELAFGGHGSAPGQLSFAGFAEFDGEGTLWVADWGNNRVQAFDGEGVYLSHFGTAGSGPGQMREPSDVAADAAGRLYVLEFGNERVQVFEPDGTPIGHFAVPEPAGSMTIANGQLYLTGEGDSALRVYRLLLPDA
jgi:outer membrane protein assembly factor BamB